MRAILIGTIYLTACGDDTRAPIDAAPDPVPDAGLLTAEERAEAAKLSPLPAQPPPDPTNASADDPKAAALGQMLFFDKSYAGALAVGDDGTNGGLGAAGSTGKVACASCHAPGSATLDDRRTRPNNVSLGTDYGGRNALGIVNSAYYRWTNWGGRFDSQWSLPLAVAEAPKIMKSTRLEIAHMLYAKYRAEYDAIFPVALDPALDPHAADAARFPPAGKPKASANDPDGAWEAMTQADRDIVNTIFANYGKALAAYTRKVISRDAPFDRFVAGDEGAISIAAQRGLKLFLRHCVSCHSGPTFSDDDFHALGVVQTGPRVPAADLGRFADVPGLLASPFNSSGPFSDDTTTGRLAGLAQMAAQTGQFRTKSLRNVAGSGPFMHTGAYSTLDAVVAFYDAGGGEVPSGATKDPELVPLGLSAADRADLVAFLETLTGAPVAAELVVDTSK